MARAKQPHALSLSEARRIWLAAQRLDSRVPFGAGPEATRAAVEHLGYVQIDTINVIERCHHHILYARIPAYRRADLAQAQSVDKSVFEYFAHALAYIPTRDLRFFIGAMHVWRRTPAGWFGSVTPSDMRKVMRLLRRNGPLTIRDIDDDAPVEKHHPWGSKKPSKRALEFAFHTGAVTIGARSGMLKTYDLIERHFGWEKRPRAATENEYLDYILARTLRAQGVVSLDSIAFLDAKRKPGLRKLIERKVRRKELVPLALDGAGKTEHWAEPAPLDERREPEAEMIHILSPFDPLIIQRKRLKLFFGYDHVFEAYVPREKREFGYFALPVLVGDRIVAALDLKTDRAAGKLLLQKWTWIGKPAPRLLKPLIEDELHRFERFQLAT